MSAIELRNLLEIGDVKAVAAFWRFHQPEMPQPRSAEEAEIAMHMARTAMNSLKFEKRAYSHSWLTERLLPSQLPDELKTSAERMYPVVCSAVGISVNGSAEMQPALVEIRSAMEYAVLEAMADRREDTVFIRERMLAARSKTLKKLFGGTR